MTLGECVYPYAPDVAARLLAVGSGATAVGRPDAAEAAYRGAARGVGGVSGLFGHATNSPPIIDLHAC